MDVGVSYRPEGSSAGLQTQGRRWKGWRRCSGHLRTSVYLEHSILPFSTRNTPELGHLSVDLKWVPEKTKKWLKASRNLSLLMSCRKPLSWPESGCSKVSVWTSGSKFRSHSFDLSHVWRSQLSPAFANKSQHKSCRNLAVDWLHFHHVAGFSALLLQILFFF